MQCFAHYRTVALPLSLVLCLREIESMRLFSILLLLNFQTSASTCLITDEIQTTWNNNYASSIIPSITSVAGNTDVLVTFPNEIEGLSLSFVFLHLGEDEDPQFVSQLGTHNENGKPAVYFTLKETFAKGGYIIANYGKDCGIQVYKKVIFSE